MQLLTPVLSLPRYLILSRILQLKLELKKVKKKMMKATMKMTNVKNFKLNQPPSPPEHTEWFLSAQTKTSNFFEVRGGNDDAFRAITLF